jgi:hypothetical protein
MSIASAATGWVDYGLSCCDHCRIDWTTVSPTIECGAEPCVPPNSFIVLQESTLFCANLSSQDSPLAWQELFCLFRPHILPINRLILLTNSSSCRMKVSSSNFLMSSLNSFILYYHSLLKLLNSFKCAASISFLLVIRNLT